MNIFLLTLLGFVLRITFIRKPEGLWNDEYVSWITASVPLGQGFWEAVLKQCHMPFYYVYLKPFVHCSDTILRLTSVVPSVLAIPVMYFVGREYSDKCAKTSALITAILPFLVYYSQEVRFYSIVFLLSAVLLLFAIKILKKGSAQNVILYSTVSLLLIFTHVFGVLFVFLISAYLIYKKKLISKINRRTIIVIAGFCIILLSLIIPIGLNILRQSPSAQWWGSFSHTNILFLFSDFLSPILTNHINAQPVFYYKKELLFVFLITMPTIAGIIGILCGFKKIKGICIASLIFITLIALLAICGKIVFITKYLTEILPVIILAISLGYENSGIIKNTIFVIFIFLNFFAIFTPFYPSKISRSEGNRLPAIILNETQPDNVVFTYYAPDRFERYLNINSKFSHISKINRFDYLENPSKIFDGIKSGESVSVVFLDSVSFIPDSYIESAGKRNLPEMFITFSIIKNELLKTLEKEYCSLKKNKIGSWTIIYGIKK